MKNKFLMYAFFAAVASYLPSHLPGNYRMIGCLTMIISIIFLYKLYADGLEDKTELSVGLGAKFGSIVSAFLVLATIIFILFMDTDFKTQAIEEAIANGSPDRDIEAMESMSSETFNYIAYGTIIFGNIILPILMGVISGAIFKHEEA